jgi:hypothetical protein
MNSKTVTGLVLMAIFALVFASGFYMQYKVSPNTRVEYTGWYSGVGLPSNGGSWLDNGHYVVNADGSTTWVWLDKPTNEYYVNTLTGTVYEYNFTTTAWAATNLHAPSNSSSYIALTCIGAAGLIVAIPVCFIEDKKLRR